MVAMGRPPIIGAHNGNIQMGGQMSAGTFKELYFSPQGRISRSTFWLRFALPVFVISMVLSVIESGSEFPLFSMLFNLAILWPGIVLAIKRSIGRASCRDRVCPYV